MKLKNKLIALALGGAMCIANAAHATKVDLELQLLVDVSGSINSSEYNLQKTGYVNAFLDSGIVNTIMNLGTFNSIAVQYVEWSGRSQQSVLVDWMQISDATSATAFSNAIGATSRAFSGSTGIGSALDFGVGLFDNNGFEGSRTVIDISGDGTTNTGLDTATARDDALAAGIDTINGITIGSSSVNQFYIDNVVGGADAFSINAASFSDFSKAIIDKLEREITTPTGIPEPGVLWLLCFGFAGLAAARFRT